MATFQDYYKILDVERGATEKEIKSAYRKLARKWHPDLHMGRDKEEAEEKIKLINEAYEVLNDPEKRSRYDRLGSNWQPGQEWQPPPDMNGFRVYTSDDIGGAGFSEFFETLFGGGGPFNRVHRSGRPRGPVRGEDIESRLNLTLEEAYKGGEKTLQLSSGEICPACNGRGSAQDSFCRRCGGIGSVESVKTLAVKIPPGIREGSRIRLKDQGAEGLNGGRRGDLYLEVRILPHQVYKLDGNDIEIQVALLPDQAVLGGEVTVPTLDGPVNVKVPPGSRAGRRLRLRGKGMYFQGGRGDQYVKVAIDIPESLSEEEIKLYRQLAGFRKGVQ